MTTTRMKTTSSALLQFGQAALMAQTGHLLPRAWFVLHKLDELRERAAELLRGGVQISVVIVDHFQRFGKERREIGVLRVDDDLPATATLSP